MISQYYRLRRSVINYTENMRYPLFRKRNELKWIVMISMEGLYRLDKETDEKQRLRIKGILCNKLYKQDPLVIKTKQE